MALQLTGAAKTDSLANLQVRMPVVVIGGGLTAIDTATESAGLLRASRSRNSLLRYETLVAERGEAAVRAALDAPKKRRSPTNSWPMPRAIRAERAAAAREGRAPRSVELLNGWGGVTIAYRRRLIDAPSYTLNHEEVAKALEEGVRFAEGLTPRRSGGRPATATPPRCASSARRRHRGGAAGPRRSWSPPARSPTPCWRARTSASSRSTASISRRSTRTAHPVKPERALASRTHAACADVTARRTAAPSASSATCIPSFSGNVVKAMGSAKQGYPVVSRALARTSRAPDVRRRADRALLDDELRADGARR